MRRNRWWLARRVGSNLTYARRVGWRVVDLCRGHAHDRQGYDDEGQALHRFDALSRSHAGGRRHERHQAQAPRVMVSGRARTDPCHAALATEATADPDAE